MNRIVLAPCSPFSVTPNLMREAAALARKHPGVHLHSHLAEELFSRLNEGITGQPATLAYVPWPKFDPALLVERTEGWAAALQMQNVKRL